MIYKNRLIDLAKNEGINYNDENQIKYAISIIKNVLFNLEENKNDINYELKNIFFDALSNIKELIRNSADFLRYKQDLITLTIRMHELAIKETIKGLSSKDIIRICDEITDLCNINMNLIKNEEENTLSKSDISFKDNHSYYINTDTSNIIISKSAYLVAKTKNDINYGVNFVGNKVFDGISKTIKLIHKKDI